MARPEIQINGAKLTEQVPPGNRGVSLYHVRPDDKGLVRRGNVKLWALRKNDQDRNVDQAFAAIQYRTSSGPVELAMGNPRNLNATAPGETFSELGSYLAKVTYDRETREIAGPVRLGVLVPSEGVKIATMYRFAPYILERNIATLPIDSVILDGNYREIAEKLAQALVNHPEMGTAIAKQPNIGKVVTKDSILQLMQAISFFDRNPQIQEVSDTTVATFLNAVVDRERAELPNFVVDANLGDKEYTINGVSYGYGVPQDPFKIPVVALRGERELSYGYYLEKHDGIITANFLQNGRVYCLVEFPETFDLKNPVADAVYYERFPFEP